MSRLTRLVPARAAFAATVGLTPSAAWAGNYWDDLAWQVRPLVLVGGEADANAATWAERLEADRCALLERRIHWLDIREDGTVVRRFDGSDTAGFEATRLDVQAAATVRERVGWSPGDEARLVLFGLDGQEKYRGRPDSLDTIWSLIDRMPMRRDEVVREPDDCAG
ncbi:MAG: DUF4174 domain-containing protein [Guyparkeria sp.]